MVELPLPAFDAFVKPALRVAASRMLVSMRARIASPSMTSTVAGVSSSVRSKRLPVVLSGALWVPNTISSSTSRELGPVTCAAAVVALAATSHEHRGCQNLLFLLMHLGSPVNRIAALRAPAKITGRPPPC